MLTQILFICHISYYQVITLHLFIRPGSCRVDLRLYVIFINIMYIIPEQNRYDVQTTKYSCSYVSMQIAANFHVLWLQLHMYYDIII